MSKMMCDACGAEGVSVNYGDAYTVICGSCSGTEKASRVIRQKLAEHLKTSDLSADAIESPVESLPSEKMTPGAHDKGTGTSTELYPSSRDWKTPTAEARSGERERCSEAHSVKEVYDVLVRRTVRLGFDLDSALSRISNELQVHFQNHQNQITLATELDLESALVVIKRVERLGVIATLSVSNRHQEIQARDGCVSVKVVSAQGRVPESVMIEGIKSGEFPGYIEDGMYFIEMAGTGGVEKGDSITSEKDDSIAPEKSMPLSASVDQTEPAEFMQCEFCLGLNKPSVTFCKHCGLKIRG